ncbi:hypothetical protein OJ997_10620 [Solirubrobacter phytolaccae]|uniref:RNA polymerase sigma factor 70 region 4 type 2 domain-containing protein n=1 Tax=Solirubrobacter phytolaccae TaxID=1404360 RepID=A0A9X3NGH8_9ACTN|nr:sigma factor-like helix-turn-helix DNA-binding protein [Solirubrobacter phytolaccae]MDA0180747.1 hypothetical protein [Solirubrobacter phytolaccae]
MPASRATAFDRLAPDQRAAVELVLRQGRSYGELSDLLGMPEETIRARARGGVATLAPDLPAPGRSGEIADWLLGQQSEAHAKRTRELLLSDPAAHTWAATVAAPLRDTAGGEAVPELPTSPDAETPRVNGKSRRAVTRDEATPTDREAARDETAPTPRADQAGEDADAPEPHAPVGHDGGSSSRLGGALLIGAAVVIVAAVIAFVFLQGDDEPETAATGDTPTATATPATTAVGSNQFALRGPAGSSSIALAQIFEAQDKTVRFALAGQGVAPNADGERYSIWLTRQDGKPLLLGDVNEPVAENGELTAAGPGNDDAPKFLEWLQTYDAMAITLDEKGAKEPGKVILTGTLPRG